MTRMQRVKEAWGAAPPAWILELARRADLSSQSAVARELGRSASYVHGLINNTYKGDMRAAQELVEGKYLASTVACPALGDIGTDKCLSWRRKAAGPFSSNNALVISMYRACHGCSRFQRSPEAEEEEGNAE